LIDIKISVLFESHNRTSATRQSVHRTERNQLQKQVKSKRTGFKQHGNKTTNAY